MLVQRVGAVAHGAETVQRRDADGSGEIAVGAATCATLFERDSYFRGHTARYLEQLHHARGPFQRRPIESPCHFQPRAGNLRLQRRQRLLHSPGVGNGIRARIDDREMRPDVQQRVMEIWPTVTTENLAQVSDIAGYRTDFLKLFGFGLPGVDYAADTDPEVTLEG